MSFSLLSIVLWAASFLGNAALLAVLVFRRRVSAAPWFTAWIMFHLAWTLTLFGVYRAGTKHLYAVVYWVGAFLDLALQVSVVLEVAAYVYRRGGTWVSGAKRRLITSGVCSVVAALLMSWAMTPASTSRLDALQARADLGATVVIALFFTTVMVISHQLGLSWRGLILREGYGIAVWSVFAFITDTLHGYWRTAPYFKLLDQVQIIGYLGVLGYWIAVFWLPDAPPLVPSLEEKKSIESFLKGLE